MTLVDVFWCDAIIFTPPLFSATRSSLNAPSYQKYIGILVLCFSRKCHYVSQTVRLFFRFLNFYIVDNFKIWSRSSTVVSPWLPSFRLCQNIKKLNILYGGGLRGGSLKNVCDSVSGWFAIDWERESLVCTWYCVVYMITECFFLVSDNDYYHHNSYYYNDDDAAHYYKYDWSCIRCIFVSTDSVTMIIVFWRWHCLPHVYNLVIKQSSEASIIMIHEAPNMIP